MSIPIGGEPRTVFVSDALQARLDGYREQRAGWTTTSVVFAALEDLRGDLAELLRTARVRQASPFAESDGQVRYLGAGPVQIRIRPSPVQAEVLEQVSVELGVPVAAWVPVLLNGYLPGRKEPENMPWLVLDER
ncbi:hypothetical protein [Saccharopolyspora pogona]|uniref:hypothetical protein n=1 Tax=Saccharopolyspora pogona TaxID=333966 RepID=UPI0016870189|nr:hypothetical protein [Saccharopolyspora pogona]